MAGGGVRPGVDGDAAGVEAVAARAAGVEAGV